MNKRFLWGVIVLLLCAVPVVFSGGVLHAQEDDLPVTRLLTVEAPPGYVNTYSVVKWSSDGALIAVEFNIVDEGNIPVESLWQIYDVATGEQLHEFPGFVAWYQHSHRALVLLGSESLPFIFDIQTDRIIASVERAGKKFLEDPIDDVIINRDESDTLHLYDAETGALRFALDSVSDVPLYSPDGSQFAVHTQGSGIGIYSAKDFSQLDHLEGYTISGKRAWNPNGQQITVVPEDTSPYQSGPLMIWTLGAGVSAPLGTSMKVSTWSPDGTQLAVPHDPADVGVYDAATGDLVTILQGYIEGPTTQLRWEGHYLARRSGSYADLTLALNIWDFESRSFIFQSYVDAANQYWFDASELVVLEPFIGLRHVSLDAVHTINRLQAEKPLLYTSSDYRWSIGADLSVDDESPAPMYVYRLNPLTLAATLEGHTDIVRYVDWSPDNQHFVSIGGPDTVILWRIDE